VRGDTHDDVEEGSLLEKDGAALPASKETVLKEIDAPTTSQVSSHFPLGAVISDNSSESSSSYSPDPSFLREQAGLEKNVLDVRIVRDVPKSSMPVSSVPMVGLFILLV